MSLVTTKEMFEKALNGGYAIGAFNINNMEIIQAVTEAADELNSPVILQVSESAIKYAKQNYLVNMVKAAVEDTDISIALHLDHGASFETCKACIDGGFTSVMIDGSAHEFEENISLTKQVVEYAHERGVVVEAELGRLAGIEDDVNVSENDSLYTNPEQAKEFVERTGCDSLAIAIGTKHGAFKFSGEANLQFDVLNKVRELLPNTPLVLHGASSIIPSVVEKCNKYGGEIPGAKGVPDDMLRKAASLGICKINMDSDIRLEMTAAIREYFSVNPKDFDPRKYLGIARQAIKDMVKEKVTNVLGSDNKK